MIEISCKRGLWFMATKSIRQIADELGVSKQAVFKKIKREPLSTSLQGLMTTVDGRLMVSVDGEKLIKQAFSACDSSTGSQRLTSIVDSKVDGSSTENKGAVDDMYTVLDTTILALREQLEVKDRQIAAKDQQLDQQAQTIMRLTDALAAAQQTAAAAQALHAGTIQHQLSEDAGQDTTEAEPVQPRSWWRRFFK